MEELITVGNIAYRVTPDRTFSFRVIVSGQVLASPAGSPLAIPFQVVTSSPGLVAKVSRDGFFAIAAYPEDVFPNLELEAYAFELTVTAEGFRPATLEVPVPMGSSLPLAPLQVVLEALPVRLQGRVMGVDGMTGEASAIVSAAVSSPDPLLLALRTPLAFEHDSATAVRACELPPDGAAKAVAAAAEGGDMTLLLSDRQGLVEGSVLRFGPPRLFEYGVVASLAAEPADLAQPGEITLTAPLRRSEHPGSPAQPVAPQLQAASAGLLALAHSGDGLLRLDGPLATASVRIAVPPAIDVEYHHLGALSDDSGYFRLDGLAGVTEAALVASAAGFLDQERLWAADDGLPINELDFRLDEPGP